MVTALQTASPAPSPSSQGRRSSPADDTILWEAVIDTARKHERLYLARITWRDYQAFLEAVGESRLRHTYDRGRLEIMPNSPEHEIYNRLLTLFVWVLAEECGKLLCTGGQMLFSREDLDRGIEPDDCYWIDNAIRVRGKLKFDFTKDPPPDLIVEIEVSRDILDRLAVLAALKVSEVWRFNGKTIQVGLLQRSGEYAWGIESAAFPNISFAEIARFLKHLTQDTDHLSIVRGFRTWVREQITRNVQG